MKRVIISLLINAGILYAAAMYLPEFYAIDSFTSGIIAAVVLALVDGLVKPIVKFVTIPINFFSLGTFSMAVNAGMLMLVDYFVDGFAIGGPLYGFIFALILSLVLSVLSGIIERLVSIVL